MIIVFDNYLNKDNTKQLWGFSAYLKEHKLLFDTGSNGRVLLKNMQSLNIDVSEIKYIFISHSHWDHIGGLDSIIELNPNITLFLPITLSKHLIKDLKSMVKNVVLCSKKPMHLVNNLYTTGLLGDDILEQSLIIENENIELITGCGHFGVENIAKVAQDITKKSVVSISGGFHLLKSSDSEIYLTINKLKELNIKKLYPTHCSGNRAIELIKKEF